MIGSGPVGSEPEERAIEADFAIPPRPEKVRGALRPANPTKLPAGTHQDDDMGTTMPGMKRVYRSSVVTLGPDATVESAELAIQQEARGLGHRPVDGTAHAQELMPPVTEAQVRRKGERIGMTPEEFRSRQGSIAFRWNHTLHENVVVGTRWEGWVEVEPDHNSGDAQV